MTMTYLKQTRINTGDQPHQRGNCFSTVVACLLGLDSPEEVIQIQEHYDHDQPGDPDHWITTLQNWLNERGYEWQSQPGHRPDNRPYMVIGPSPKSNTHICIYQNGKLLHDPHPDGSGLVSEDSYSTLEPLTDEEMAERGFTRKTTPLTPAYSG